MDKMLSIFGQSPDPERLTYGTRAQGLAGDCRAVKSDVEVFLRRYVERNLQIISVCVRRVRFPLWHVRFPLRRRVRFPRPLRRTGYQGQPSYPFWCEQLQSASSPGAA